MKRNSKGRRILPAFFLFGFCAVLFSTLSLASLIAPKNMASALKSSRRIRVRLAEVMPKVLLRGFDLRIGDKTYGKLTEWEFRCQDGRVRALSTEGHQTIDLKEPATIESPTGFLSFHGRPYREEVRIYSVGSFCEVINVVDLEKYLDGLVNAEFSSKWNEEAIAAQIIAARTYALYQMKVASKKGAHFDVDATIKDQVYDGSIREDFRASRAVERTRGWVLAVPSGGVIEPVKAYYHSTCGGQTELPQKVWGAAQPGFLRRVSCPFCRVSPVFSWTHELSQIELVSTFLSGARSEVIDGALPKGWPKNWAEVLREGKLLDVRVVTGAHGPRVTKVMSEWKSGNQLVTLEISPNRFRGWLGVSKMRSTAFQVSSGINTGLKSPMGRVWRFNGYGNGHGVGMCQWGAKVMGEKGFKVAQILQHYYPDAMLKKLW